MRADLTKKNIVEIKEEITKNDYRNCEILVSQLIYTLVKGFNGGLFKGLNKLLEERRIEVIKSDKEIQ